MACFDDNTIWSALLTLSTEHMAPLTSLFVGCVGSCRRAVLLWERIRLGELVHMEISCRGGVPNLPGCHGRAPIASSTFSAFFRCFEGARLLRDRNSGSSVDIRVKPKHMLTEVLAG